MSYRESSTLLLAIESSSPHLSVALFKGHELLSELSVLPDERGHAAKLVPLVDRLIKSARVKLSEIENFAMGSGPGSYTSLRVGMATVIGFTQDRPVRIYTVSTLRALCFGVPREDALIVPVYRAGRERVYSALYRKREREPILSERVFEPASLVRILEGHKGEKVVIGPGAGLLQGILEADYLTDVTPSARLVAEAVFVDQPQPVAPFDARIRYLQEPDLGLKAPDKLI